MADPKKDIEGEPAVDVKIVPAESSEGDYAERVGKQVEKEVRDAIKKHKGDGHRKQLDAAEDAVNDAAKRVSPRKVDEIKVDVGGKVDGDEHSRKVKAKPKGQG